MAMAARQHKDLAVFHANVVGSWSEHHAAAALAKHLKLDLHSVDVHEQDFVDNIPDVMRQYEHPFTYHPNCSPFMLVSRLVKEHGVKGMLSGEGSDELFLGYPWMGRQRAMNAYNALLNRTRTLIQSIPAVGQLIWPHQGNHLKVVRNMLNRCEIADDKLVNRTRFNALPAQEREDGMLTTLDYLNYHLRSLLHRNDCLGMEASIEARFPFLDHDLVRNAVNMPTRHKLHFSPTVMEKAHPMVRDKWVVRKVADRYIPKQLSQRIKLGFWTTVFQRLDIDPSYFDDSPARDLFSLSRKQMHAAIHSADQDLSMRLLHLDVWGRVCLQGESREPIMAKLRDFTSIRPE
jgi:asparagine synthase (glutamine-hydrolysing)